MIFKSLSQLKTEALRFVQTQELIFHGTGFFIVVIFVQLSGQPEVWHAILGKHYVSNVGRFVEKFFEFLGYGILFIGSIECLLSAGTEDSKSAGPQRVSHLFVQQPQGKKERNRLPDGDK